MSHVLRWAFVGLLVAHGLLHLLGAAKGFGWAAVSQLEESIGPVGRRLVAARRDRRWLPVQHSVAARTSTWWAVVLVGAVVSQIAIVTSWSDAKYGTAVNLVLLLAAAYGFAALGPTSFHAQYRDLAAEAVADVRPEAGPSVSEEDLAELPGAARCLRTSVRGARQATGEVLLR